MADSTTNLHLVTTNQGNKEGTMNAFMDAASGAATFGRDDTTTTGLTWGYLGGRIGLFSVDNGTIVLTASVTNYIVVNKVTGAVTASTSGANWCTPQTYARLYKVVCSAFAISSYKDYRFGRGGVHALQFGGTVQAGRVEIALTLDTPATSLTTGTRKVAVRAPCALLLTNVRAAVSTVSTSGTPTFDLNDGADSVLRTKLTIDANETSSTTAATAYAWTDGGNVFLDDADINIDCDTAGTGTKGAVFWLIGERGWGDPGWDLVKSALTLEGANGGTTWTDGVSGRTWTLTNGATTSTTQSLNSTFGNYAASSTYFNGATFGSVSLHSDTSADFDLQLEPWTLGFWVRMSSVANVPIMVDIGSSSANRMSISVDSGTLRFYTQTPAQSGAYRITGSSISTGTWYYIEAGWDGTTLTLWLDGVSQGTYAVVNGMPTGSLQVWLGNYGFGSASTYAVEGYMQRFRFTRGWCRHTAAFTRPAKPYATY